MALYSIGSEIHEGLKEKGTENKLDGYVYKMLNCVKNREQKEFMDNVIRLHMAFGKRYISNILRCNERRTIWLCYNRT